MINKYDWDLDDILKGKSLEDLHNEWLKKMSVLIKEYDNQYDNIENFINYKKKEQEYVKVSNRLSNYISNNSNEDSVNHKWLSWNQKISFEIQELLLKTANDDNLTIKNKKKILEYLKDKRLEEYRRGYDLFFRRADRILSEKEELLLTKLSKLDNGFEDIYSSVVDSTTKFSDVKDSKGKTYKLNSIADVFKTLKNHDSVLRKNTWIEFNKQYYNSRFILTQTLYYNYLQLNEYSKIRKYKNYVESVCDSDEVNLDFVQTIYDGVQSFASEYKKFYKTRDKIISYNHKIKKIEPWDRNLDVIKINNKYSIEDIQKILINVFSIFGDEYVSIVKKAFDERWISWLPKPNKHSGAYSIGGTKGLDKYYISMNYDSTISSLFTAAHELGHSLHSYYFNRHQKLHCSCVIFYAEIASITNEMLLSYHLLEKSNSLNEKLFILDEMITNFFSTTTRQIIFSNFEYEMINKIENNLPVTHETIFDSYQNMVQKYTNSTKRINPNKKPYNFSLSTILRIDHFYVGNFYVYKYAIGQICAMIIARKIYSKDKRALENFFKFLKSGSSLSPIDTIKLLGINFSDKTIWDQCKAILNDLISQYNTLKNKIIKK